MCVDKIRKMPRSESPDRRDREKASSSRHHDREYRTGDRERDRERDRGSRSRRYDDEEGRKASSRRRSYDSEKDERDEEERRRRRHRRSRERGSESEEEEKRRRRRRRSRDLSDSAASEEEVERERRHRRKKEKRRETSEERAIRKAAKKSSKKGSFRLGEDEAEKRAKAAETLFYAADANPFNDDNISQKFRWGKKEEKERKAGMTPMEARRKDEERRKEAEEEIKRLIQKRVEREKEQALREEEESKKARMAESAAMSEWVAKEDDFYLEQSRRRAVIRVREQRAKPIDILAINLKWVDPHRGKRGTKTPEEEADGDGKEIVHPADEDDEENDATLEIDLEEPYLIFENLDLDETEELEDDIRMYLSLEKDEQNLDFWRAMVVVCEDRLSELREEAGQTSTAPGIRSRLEPSVKADMNEMLSTKSYDELVKLQGQVRAKLQSGEPVDVEYWEALLKNILVWRAKAKLRDLHEVVISNRLEYLKRRQREDAARREALGLPSAEEEKAQKEQERKRRLEAAAEAGRTVEVHDDGEPETIGMFETEAGRDLDEDEDVFNVAEDLGRKDTYDWEDKFRPRKPRYFNRVHTGYEWNKYNQTHYDTDNPPPKVVQGYKFSEWIYFGSV